MSQTVQLPDNQTAEFPDDMPPEKISEVLRKQFPPRQSPVDAAVAKSQDNAYRSAVEATKAPNFGVDPVPPSAASASIPEGSLPNLQSLRAGKITAEPKTSLRDMLSPILGERAAEGISGFARGVGESAAEKAKGLIPTSLEQVNEMATPVISAVKEISETGRKVADVVSGKPISEVSPQGKAFPELTATDWGKFVGGIGVDVGMAALLRKGIKPKLADTLSPVLKDLQPESPTPATDVALERTITDATQEREIESRVQPERQGDVTSRPPEEAGAVGLVRPAAQGAAQEALVQPSTESPLASTAEPAAVSGTESPPAAVAPDQPIPQIPSDATASVKFKTPEGREVATEMNAREAEGIFTKERSSYQALLDCLGK